MKKFIRSVTLAISICISILLLSVSKVNAQIPPNPGNGSDPGGGSTPVGGGSAPSGSGFGILLVLGAAYGGKKVYDLKKKSKHQ